MSSILKKGKCTNKMVHDQKIQIKLYRGTHNIPTDEEGGSKGGRGDYYGFFDTRSKYGEILLI